MANLARVQQAVKALRELRSAGWSATPSVRTIRIESPISASLDGLLEDLGPVRQISDWIRATGRLGDSRVDVIVDSEGMRAVADTSEGDLSTDAPPRELAAARAVWSGQVARIAELTTIEWTVAAELDLSDLISDDDNWVVVWEFAQWSTLLDQIPFWRWGEFLPRRRRTVVIAADLGDGDRLHAPGLTIAGIDFVDMDDKASLPPGSLSVVPALNSVPDPRLILPESLSGDRLQAVAERLTSAAAVVSWLPFATTIEVGPASVSGEIFGLQRLSFEVSTLPSVSTEQARRALDLLGWAQLGASTDHVLAVRQVASLSKDEAPWTRSGEVKRGAESVFLGLRTETVADVLKVRRDAHSTVVSAALQAADRSSAMARTLVERTAATFLAIAGVVVAESTKAISPDLAATLRHFLAVALLAVALWNVFLEGPYVTLPITAMRKDLSLMSDVLSEADRTELLNLTIVRSSFRRGVVLRVVVPAVILAAAVVCWTI